MSGKGVERRLAAIVAADVAGYSRLMGLDEVGTAQVRGKVAVEFADLGEQNLKNIDRPAELAGLPE